MSIEQRKLQTRLDKVVLVGKVQFETEFKALADIWQKLSRFRIAMVQVRPSGGLAPLDETDAQRLDALWERVNRFAAASNAFRDAVEDQSPFYPQGIYYVLMELLKLGTKEYVQVKTAGKERTFSSAWYDQADENTGALHDHVDKVGALIRARLAALEVVGETATATG